MNILKILKKTVYNFLFQLEFNSYIKKSKDNKYLIEKNEFFAYDKLYGTLDLSAPTNIEYIKSAIQIKIKVFKGMCLSIVILSFCNFQLFIWGYIHFSQ